MDRTKLIKKLSLMQGDRPRKDLARQLKVTPGYLSDIFNGNRDPGPELLKKLGLERRVTYVEVK